MPAYGIERFRLDFETEASGEAHCPQQSQLVLAKTAPWFADCPDNPGRQISLPFNIIEHFAGVVTHQQPVNREIASLYVFFRAAREHYGVWMASVRITDVSAEGCHLHLYSISIHSDDAKLCPDRYAIGKQHHYLIGSGVGRHVVIRRSAP